jgi:mannose-6-phosphate isomerase-like protein (cupin superfamily)
MRTVRPLDLESTFAVLGPGASAVPVAVTPTIYEELDRRFDGFRGHHLVSIYTFTSDWPTWEMHPAGDEVVCLLDGEARMVFDRGGAEETVTLSKAGSYVIVPKATWHTAQVSKSARMLFITPGEGTQNRPLADKV